MEHEFTQVIKEILYKLYGDYAEIVYQNSYLLQYINNKRLVPANRCASKSERLFC